LVNLAERFAGGHDRPGVRHALQPGHPLMVAIFGRHIFVPLQLRRNNLSNHS
jgi:hypothetical protein